MSFLVGDKEKQFVLFDWSPNYAAVLILIQDALFIWFTRHNLRVFDEEVVCVENRISKKFKGGTVEIIASGFSNDVHACAGIPTVPGVVLRSLNFELLNRVGVWNS